MQSRINKKMRSVMRLGFPALVFVLLIAVLLNSLGASNQVDWQSEINQYVFSLNSQLPGRFKVQSVVPASQPKNFKKEMSMAVFGDSVHYQTDNNDRQKRVTTPTASASFLPSDLHENRIPPPFPPKRVWCVLLEYEGDASEQKIKKVVFVAEHISLHEADMLVHEGTNTISSLSAIGCDLELDS